MEKRISRLEEVVAYSEPDNQWVKVFFDVVAFPNGTTGRYNRIVESNGRPGVVILPVRGRAIGLIRQYRYPIDAEVWEIPRGFGESDDPRLDAIRELREETGIENAEIVELGSIHPNSGLLVSNVHVFAACCSKNTQAGVGDGLEAEEFRWLSLEDALAEIADGRLTDGYTLCAILLAQTKGLL